VSSYAWLGVVLAVRAGRIGHRGVAPTSGVRVRVRVRVSSWG